jgi:hypothetical protein
MKLPKLITGFILIGMVVSACASTAAPTAGKTASPIPVFTRTLPAKSMPTQSSPVPPNPAEKTPTALTTARPSVTPQVGAPESIIWEKTDNTCQTARISKQGVKYGSCNGKLTTTNFVSPMRNEDLAYLVKTYASFAADTRVGKIIFNGAGEQTASPAEKRSIAEWARLVSMESASGSSGEAHMLAFAWHREGGFAGFCDDLSVYLSGEAIASTCKGNQPTQLGRFRLTAEQLAQVYQWVDSYQSFEISPGGPVVPDEMVIRLTFSGSGTKEATEATRETIQNFASQILGGMRKSP